ncbi:unnamed protein product [Paramecium sonneborni]|uniref:Uncharacterized protein n=1 Tax=Paramecium sonneborni TaxID=65129 RepID=A0A8S1K5A5_9CILI|nr:unnamed protein product [Paramecium sonneborni]
MLNLLQINQQFQTKLYSPYKKEKIEQIVQKLKDKTIIIENICVTQLLTCLNQLQLILSLQTNQYLKLIIRTPNVIKFDCNISIFQEILENNCEKDIFIEKLQYLEYLDVKILSNGNKQLQLNPNFGIIEKLATPFQTPNLDELLAQFLKNQDIQIQLFIKLYCIISILQCQFNQIIINQINLHLEDQDIEEPIKNRVYLTNLQIIYQTQKQEKDQMEVKPINYQYQYNKLLIYQQAENNLITRAFDLLDNTMYPKRKRSFEKDKESAYQNFSQKNQFEMSMDIFRVDPYMSYQALFSEVAPPQQSPVLTHVSTFPKPNSMCLSPTNSDSHSFTSQKNKGFNCQFSQVYQHLIDQNQYAQISQQNIDAQIRQRKMLINEQQNQRVSRSKSNSTVIMPDIFKQICLDSGKNDEKNDEKQKQKVTKKTLNLNQNPKKCIQNKQYINK